MPCPATDMPLHTYHSPSNEPIPIYMQRYIPFPERIGELMAQGFTGPAAEYIARYESAIARGDPGRRETEYHFPQSHEIEWLRDHPRYKECNRPPINEIRILPCMNPLKWRTMPCEHCRSWIRMFELIEGREVQEFRRRRELESAREGRRAREVKVDSGLPRAIFLQLGIMAAVWTWAQYRYWTQ